jgi:glycosyltransferase involved in cell wall biosynthesis
MPQKPDRTVCLAMIVKNEAHVLARSLGSVRWMLSSWVICDTGSTDDTERVAREALAGIPGDFVHRPWVDFAHNRTESLALARPKADYSLILDADDVIEASPGAELPPLRAEAYDLPVDQKGLLHFRPHLISNRRAWRYEGALHERLVADGGYERAPLKGFVYRWTGEGARQKDPLRLTRDIEVLERETVREPNNPRHWFFLGQTLLGAEQWERAMVAYERRIALDPNGEEPFISKLQIAACLAKLERPAGEVIQGYLSAYALRPARAEPLCYLAGWFRRQGQPAQALAMANAALALPKPNDRLLVDLAVYEWKSLYEKAAACFRLGWYEQCIAANQDLLRIRGKVPGQAERIQGNIDAARKAAAKRR